VTARTSVRRRATRLAATSALLASLALSGCTTGVNVADACPAAPTATKAPDGISDNLSSKPAVKLPSGAKPTTLQVLDVKKGAGPVACSGDALTVKYVGVTYDNGKQFDASWDRGQDFPFTIGQMAVIEGWDKGLLGMQKGGRRELIIPPALGYGTQGAGKDIPPGATLAFVVDLVDVTKAAGQK